MVDNAYARVGNGQDIVNAATSEGLRLRLALSNQEGTLHTRALAHLLRCAEDGQQIDPLQLDQLFHLAVAEDGRIPGMCFMGYMFENAVAGIPQSSQRARWFFERDIACFGCDLARFALAESLTDDDRVQTDPVRAVQLYEMALRGSGFNLVARKLAALLDMGAEGVERDSKRAEQLYWRAVEEGGSTEAMFSLGRMYEEGREDVERDVGRAVELYERAIEEGEHSNAMNSLALLLQDGRGGVVDVGRAVELFERAIRVDNNCSALNNLGFLISEGYEGVERDMRRVVRLYERASEEGNRVATRNLARLLQRGDEGVQRDAARALELFESLRGDMEMFKTVRFEVALLLSGGEEGVLQDTVRAATIYEEIIREESNVSAMFNLACMLSEARGGLTQDNKRAVALYERAILEGQDVLSMLNLGILLGCSNEGIEKDKDRAIELLERAAQEGRKDANYHLGVVLVGFDGDPVDVPRSIRLFEKAIDELDHIGAMIDLSVLLGEGLHGVEQDVDRALALSERAIAVGLENDREALREIGIEIGVEGGLKEDLDSVRERKHSISRGSHLISMLNLAELLLSGNIPMDVDRAVKLCERALTDKKARELCGFIQFEDLLRHTRNMTLQQGSTLYDCRKAVRIYELIVDAAELNPRAVGHAARLLADVLLDGSRGVERDEERALGLYEHAVEVGDYMAAVVLGEILNTGIDGIARNERAAFDMFILALRETTDNDIRCNAAVNLAVWFDQRGGKQVKKKTGKLQSPLQLRKAFRRYFRFAPPLPRPFWNWPR